MAGTFTGIKIFTCEGGNGGVHGDFMVGNCVPENCSVIVKGIGSLLSYWSGFQYGKFRQVNVGLCFGENNSRCQGGFKVIIDVVYGFFIIDN